MDEASGRRLGALGCALALLAGLGAVTTPPADAGGGRADEPDRCDASSAGDLGHPGYHHLTDVVMIGPDEAWASGAGGSDARGRARHWDGDQWTPTDPPHGPSCPLDAVDALSSSDAWVVGNDADNNPLAAHWDGTGWTKVDTPVTPPPFYDRVHSVEMVATDDVWAVGVRLDGGSPDVVPLILHWDGTDWSEVPYELPFGNDQGRLEDVVAIAADDVWAVGKTSGRRFAPLLLHWDGETWSPETDIVGSLLKSSQMFSVDAVTSDDVWAVGSDSVGSAVMHWDGSEWTYRRLTDEHTRLHQLIGVDALSADDVWAVGGYSYELYRFERAQAWHWDGTDWTQVPVPNPGSRENALRAVSGIASDDVWSVGYTRYRDRTINLYSHGDGERWTRFRNRAPQG